MHRVLYSLPDGPGRHARLVKGDLSRRFARVGQPATRQTFPTRPKMLVRTAALSSRASRRALPEPSRRVSPRQPWPIPTASTNGSDGASSNVKRAEARLPAPPAHSWRGWAAAHALRVKDTRWVASARHGRERTSRATGCTTGSGAAQ